MSKKGSGGQTSLLPAVIISLVSPDEADEEGDDPLAPGEWGSRLFKNLACLGADNRLMKVMSERAARAASPS